jgi:hypothetical protein
MSLHNLGIRLSEMGRREEALQATQEAVEHPAAAWPPSTPTPSSHTWR